MAPSSASKEKKAPVAKGKKPQAAAEDSSAFGPIAERFRRAGDLDRAVSLCREGLQKFPDRLSARVTLGWALLELGKYDEAQAELEQVLRQRPDNLAAIRALAELHDRAEQTLNLPMDGPGQWPPSPDAVDEVGSMVAGSFMALAGDDAVDQLVNAAGAPLHAPAQPAVVPPAELGLAMWSALPATEPEPERAQEFPGRTLFVGDAIAAAALDVALEQPQQEEAIDARAEGMDVRAEDMDVRAAEMDVRAEEEQPVHAQASGVSDADLAALLAEADSLDALADTTPAPAVAFQAMAEAADVAASFETSQDSESALVLNQEDDGQDLPLEELTWGVPAVEIEPEPVAYDSVAAAQPEPMAVAQVPDVQLEAEPGFQLESLSIGAIEAMPLEAALAVEPESFAVDPDLQPILRFDLEPVAAVIAEPIAGFVPEPMAAAVSEPIAESVAEPFVAEVAFAEAVVLPETVAVAEAVAVPEEVVESAVIAQTQARIAAVLSMARATEIKTATRKEATSRAQLQALEHLLACVEARRRRVLTESVA